MFNALFKKTFLKKLGAATLFSVSVISLQGCVTAAVVGTVAAVTAVTKVATDPRTTGVQVDDETLEEKIRIRLNRDSQLKEETRIEIVSYNGNVLLTGQAPDVMAVNTAQNIVAGVDGVKNIYNEIRIGRKITVGRIAKDSLLTAQAKTELLRNVSVKSSNVKIYTENAEVFLMGKVTQSQAKIVVDIVRHIKGVKKVITAFDYVK
ncbi:outer membrane lipoprotein [Phocoenobacter uteri]|uniref:Outer membrane lipoprotein n=1 Tax=Phocoenobacter uteri TaxID=146806 RepID=A0A379CD80_9PAST|nr:division/outer membrane stress-associated lipid-binding lipoprotein [Phocoenobacter uteri]MDG6881671.1 BON domain-containing protein [Phocoenobacter uteri]SUB59706.1 outer membrane lipoprotein [Phocoenobacter uteri]